MSSSRRSMKSLSTPAGSRKINNGRFAATDIIDTDDGAADIDVTCHCTVMVRIQAPLCETIDAAHSSRKLNCLRGCQTERPSFGMTGLMLSARGPGSQCSAYNVGVFTAIVMGPSIGFTLCRR